MIFLPYSYVTKPSKGSIITRKSSRHKLLTKSGAKIGSLELSSFRLMKKNMQLSQCFPDTVQKILIPLPPFVKLHIHTELMHPTVTNTFSILTGFGKICLTGSEKATVEIIKKLLFKRIIQMPKYGCNKEIET